MNSVGRAPGFQDHPEPVRIPCLAHVFRRFRVAESFVRFDFAVYEPVRTEKVYYFDNNATTRVAPEVVDAMIPFLRDLWGNPSDAYAFGAQVHGHVEKPANRSRPSSTPIRRRSSSRAAAPSRTTRAINSALFMNPGKKHVITTTKVEHSANINFGEFLQKKRLTTSTYLPVESDGSLDVHLLEKSIRPDTAIVSVMMANNETGVIFPIAEIAAICRSKGVLCHTDAVQVPGKLKLDVP
jgi:cysteine desulfurase